MPIWTFNSDRDKHRQQSNFHRRTSNVGNGDCGQEGDRQTNQRRFNSGSQRRKSNPPPPPPPIINSIEAEIFTVALSLLEPEEVGK